MARTLVAVLALSVVALSCQSSSPRIVSDLDASKRATLLDAVKSLEGTWEMPAPEGEPGVTEFRVSSGGSVVREIMFPGAPHEMTNVYHLDGNALVMTHYCASGNQPRMRATSVDGNRIAFASDSVSDLKPTDAAYMGELTLELVDGDHFVQHWQSYSGDVKLEPQRFPWTRRR